MSLGGKMSLEQMFLEAKALYRAGKYAEAEQNCRQILSQIPENADVLNLVGLIAHAKGYPDTAVSYFERVLRQNQNLAPTWFNMAVSLTACGKYKEALEAYQNVIKCRPDVKETYNNMGGVYEKLNRLQDAYNAYRQALALDPAYVDAAVNLAVLEHNTEALKALCEKHPQSALPLYYLGLEAFKQGDYHAAARLLQKALKNERTSAEIWFQCGLTAQALGKEKTAQKCYHQVLALEPKNVPALVNLANLTHDETLYVTALGLNPQNAEAHTGYADLLYTQDRKTEALEEYRKAVILNPDMPQISNNLGLILKDLGDYEQALDLFMNAFLKEKHIKDYAINISETLVLLYRQSPERAVEIAKLWVQNAPGNVLAEHTLASLTAEGSDKDALYSEEYFDIFAKCYEDVMQKIRYNIINKIKELQIELKGKILDLGCGTGLAGMVLKTNENSFTGIDISQKMLEIAKSKGVYEKLVKDDIRHFLDTNVEKFDKIIAFDVLNYVEDMAGILSAARGVPLVFSVENAPQDVAELEISPAGRYRHNPVYIRRLLIECGYQNIQSHQFALRLEENEPVEGTLFQAQ